MKTIKIDDKILLKPISLASAQTIYDSIDQSRKHLKTWLPFVDKTRSVINTREFIKSTLNSRCPKKDEILEIWHENQFAGLIGLKEIDNTNRKVEFGYWLDSSMTGRGIMIKACKSLISYVFSNYNMNRVMMKVAEGNEKSIRIPEVLGFTFEGMERDGEFINERYHDLRVYSILKKEWKV